MSTFSTLCPHFWGDVGKSAASVPDTSSLKPGQAWLPRREGHLNRRTLTHTSEHIFHHTVLSRFSSYLPMAFTSQPDWLLPLLNVGIPKELVFYPCSLLHVHTFFRKITSQAPSKSYNLLTPKSLIQAPCSRPHMDIPWVPKTNSTCPNRIHYFCLNLPILDLPTPNQAKGIPEAYLTPSSLLPHSLRHLFSLYSTPSQPWPRPLHCFWTTILASSMVSSPSRTCSTIAATWTLNQPCVPSLLKTLMTSH